ncbi:hypothetical protein [Bosea thiooxidans]
MRWLFEIGPAEARLRREEGLQPILSRIATAPEGELILRIDRVGSAAGAQTPAHRHRGPGIRRLVSGLLHAEVGGHFDRIEPGQAWFESGREDVVGTNVSGGDNSFVRVMLLPSELAGGASSFVAASPVDAAKPRAARDPDPGRAENLTAGTRLRRPIQNRDGGTIAGHAPSPIPLPLHSARRRRDRSGSNGSTFCAAVAIVDRSR